MKHQWHMRRSFAMSPDGQARWDRAYQHLLEWSQQAPQPSPTGQSHHEGLDIQEAAEDLEVVHAHSGVCARLDAQSGAHADH